jgi:hypothetical protein
MEDRSGDSPDDHNAGRNHERQSSPGGLGRPIGYLGKQLSSTATGVVLAPFVA